jgi:hypothetical protein
MKFLLLSCVAIVNLLLGAGVTRWLRRGGS